MTNLFFSRCQNIFHEMRNRHINFYVRAVENSKLIGSNVQNLHNLMYVKIVGQNLHFHKSIQDMQGSGSNSDQILEISRVNLPLIRVNLGSLCNSRLNRTIKILLAESPKSSVKQIQNSHWSAMGIKSWKTKFPKTYQHQKYFQVQANTVALEGMN